MTIDHKTSYRPTTMSKNGMITTPHYLASQAGMAVLQNGGNAIEAAIAAASTISVVYPHMNSIGGDNFWLIYDAKKKKVLGLNSSGRSGENVSIPLYKVKGYEKSIPIRGYLSANTVPGAVAGWEEAYNYSRHKLTGEFSWETLLQSAISYAREGYPVTPSQQYWTEVNMENSPLRYLQRFEEFRKVFLKEGKPYKTGEILKQPDLANTLEEISKKGASAFYSGSIAQKMIEDFERKGGLLTRKDFENHRSDWVNPISVNYRGFTAYNLPPNTQGFASLSILNILNHFDFSNVKENSTEYFHLMIEATKRAFMDRDTWLCDPTFTSIPIDDLLSTKRGKELAGTIDFQSTCKRENALDPKGDTVWFGVVDKEGNAVSFIQSIYHEFGSGIIPKGTGVLLQNRGSFFSLDPNHINCLEPKKRSFHTLNPAMLLKNEKPYLVYGSMGGEGQPQTQAALVTRIIDYGNSVQAAIEAPRWLYGRTWGVVSNDVKVEARISSTVIEDLKILGHPIKKVEDFTDVMGHAGAIMLDPVSKVKYGGADPRGDGAALGY
ncbi:gamma-glutamyltransferase [Evansella cellulosilytica]|uniref:Glutathione hydrolase proenzyme n=1 Tax=Evansella cellulosilytica (strain ATCC 21833 / DSM 2522 / FERM P-1141 / JCM 9156 / N-4) TaxID=649639 RepID=E6TSJ9_EVAC2|nr:gamma-glutamyltransferase [Evansella cellulosilytica]ADU29507.1 gamma-glutamyltransferase [Evansella cellulosilytica DSM 2522]